MNLPCPNREVCPGTDNPLGNYSTEASDRLTYLSFNYPYNNPNTPLGPGTGNAAPPSYFALGCDTICESTISQEDANLCAQRAAYICAHTPTDGGPSPSFFYNTLQVCNVQCADGSLFSYRVFAGSFVATSQAQANDQAAAYACQQAGRSIICLNSIPQACLNERYATAIGNTARGFPPFTYVIISGTVPPGLVFQQISGYAASLVGIPTVAGSYNFTVRATDSRGNFTEKSYSLNVMALLNTPPGATQGQAYSFQYLVAGGVPPYTFVVDGGALPAGLTMSSSGLISGTPTTAETANFSVSFSDSST